jgi:hypothetical protein
MKLYKNIFAAAWHITRLHPALWVLGAFVLFWGGKAIELEQFITNADLLRSELSPFRPTFWENRQWLVIADLFVGNELMIAGFIALLVLAALLAFMLIMGAHVGLIDAYGQFEHGKSERYTFQHAFAAIKQYILPVSIVQGGLKLIAYALLLIVALPLFFDELGVWQLATALVLFFLVTPMSVVLSATAKFASNAIVLKGMAWPAALNEGFRIVRSNVGVLLEFMVFVYLMYTLLTLLIFAAINVLTLPLLFGEFFLAVKQQTLEIAPIYGFVSLSLIAIFTFIAAAIFSAWHMGSWTLLFEELSTGHHRSLSHRLWKRQKIEQ